MKKLFKLVTLCFVIAMSLTCVYADCARTEYGTLGGKQVTVKAQITNNKSKSVCSVSYGYAAQLYVKNTSVYGGGSQKYDVSTGYAPDTISATCTVTAGYNITSCTVYGKATLSNGDECVQSFTVRN